MLSRGRPCLRRRLSAVLDTVATGPDEPLLFLYPRWAAPALRQRRPISSLNPIEGPVKKCQASGAPFCPVVRPCPSLTRHSCRWISVNSARTPHSTLEFPPSSNKQNRQISAKNVTSSDALIGSAGDRSSADKEQSGNSLNDAENTTSQRALHGFALTRARRIQKSIQQPRPKGGESSTLTPTQRYNQHTSLRDQKKLRARAYMKKQYRKRSWPYIDKAWFDTKDVIEETQHNVRIRVRTRTKQKEIYVAEETLALFAGVNQHTFQENIWHVPINNGCRVQVLPARENKGLLRRVILSGTDRVLELVEGQFTRAQNSQETGDPLADIHKPLVPICSSRGAMERSKVPVPLVRGIWCFQEDWKSRLTFDEVMMARPIVNSVKDFNEHVEDVTSSRLPYLDEKAMNPSKTPDIERITKHILKLFDTHHKYISTAALHLALEFLCQHELISAARDLCSRAEQVATANTYNIMLKIAAQRQDVRVFRHLIREMGRAHLNPNSETWLTLLSALVKPSEKAELIGHMVQCGYMSDINTIQGALQQTIQDSLLVHLESGKDIDSFIDLMASTYGANWFSSSLMGQMFSTLARLKDHDSLKRLVQICIDRKIPLDGHAMNAIVTVFRSDVFTAVRYILKCLDVPWFQSSREQWELLFLAAFKRRHYNICLVLWRYACMYRVVTQKMKQTVLVSLCRNAFAKKNNELSTLWNIDAGKVIVGIDLHHESYSMADSILDEIPSEFRHNPLLFLIGWKPEGSERAHQIRLANALIQRDIKLGPLYKPNHPFRFMLDAAAFLDSEWHDVPRPLTWKMQNAIHIPIIRKDQ
jgi:hypothetical protein